MPATVSKPIPRLFSFILLFLLVRPVHVDVIVNTSLSRILFSIWPRVAVNIIYFLFHAIDALGGGYRRNTRSSARYAHGESPTRVQLPALQPTNATFTPRRGMAFLTNLGDRYKRHAARTDMESATSAAIFTPTSAGTQVSAIEHRQRLYTSVLMDWVVIPLRETQPPPRPRQRKVPTKANSFHRAGFCRRE